MENELVFSVSDFVAVLNQTMEFAYPSVSIVGELSNFRVSKNRWVYFDLKDEDSSVKFFGTVYSLPGPLEDGMMLEVRGVPRLHNLYGFSVNVQAIKPVGEGSLKKAAALLQAKLEKEGLFDPARKRNLPYPPKSIALISSTESAAYADFMKILGERWGGVQVDVCNVQVQGELAIGQIVDAIATCNTLADPPEVLVITRGGGGADDLAVFNTEQVTRAIATSRIPTLVAIGHEIDISLAELAADVRASTPSNAAELLTPDRKHEIRQLRGVQQAFAHALTSLVDSHKTLMQTKQEQLLQMVRRSLENERQYIQVQNTLLIALSPQAALQRGYAIIRNEGEIVKSVRQVKVGQKLVSSVKDGVIISNITSIEVQ